jgi:hypothetical protein
MKPPAVPGKGLAMADCRQPVCLEMTRYRSPTTARNSRNRELSATNQDVRLRAPHYSTVPEKLSRDVVGRKGNEFGSTRERRQTDGEPGSCRSLVGVKGLRRAHGTLLANPTAAKIRSLLKITIAHHASSQPRTTTRFTASSDGARYIIGTNRNVVL